MLKKKEKWRWGAPYPTEYFTEDGYMTIAGWCKLRSYYPDRKTKAKFGRMLAALCRREGIEVRSLPHDRWSKGKINMYPVALLDELRNRMDE